MNGIEGLGSLLYRLMASYMYTPEVLAEAERVRRRKKSNEASGNGLLIHHGTQVDRLTVIVTSSSLLAYSSYFLPSSLIFPFSSYLLHLFIT